MSDCCHTLPAKKLILLCPQCGQPGKIVPLITLYHHVKFPENLAIVSSSYYYCSSPECPVGYFSSSATIARQQLRTFPQIQQGWLCYCFDISEQQYLSSLQSKNARMIKDFVIAQTKAATCTCSIRNPSGQCCLAKFKALEKNSIQGT